MITELQRLLSKKGIASRKEASELIKSGKVKVNGRVCLNPSAGFDSRVLIEVDGEAAINQKKFYLILNKPRGLVVTRSDEHNRRTVYECLKNWKGPLLQAVGRLDQASEGLLLFTNDHIWADALSDPKTHIPKVYHVQISPHASLEQIKRLSEGILLEGKKTLPAEFEIIKASEKTMWISVQLKEGRNRQIRKMLASENIEVLRLVRVKVGELSLGALPKGEWRELDPLEVKII